MLEVIYKTYNLLLGPHSYFELSVGTKPSFGFFKMLSTDVDDLLEHPTEPGAPGDLVLTDGTNTVTLKNIYLVKSLKRHTPTGSGPYLCDVVLADARILWYFKYGTRSYNTYKASREGVDEFTLTNLNTSTNPDGEEWTFPELITELETLTGASSLVLNSDDFNNYPARNPRHVVGCNITVSKILQQVLEQLYAFLTIDLNSSGPFDVTYEIYRLGVTEEAADVVQLTSYAHLLKERRTIELNSLVQHGATIKMRAAAEDELNDDLRSRLYGNESFSGGSGSEYLSSMFAVLGGEENQSELDSVADEICTEYTESFSNVWRDEIYTGLIPFKLNRAVHLIRWFFNAGGAFTHIKSFRPKPERAQIVDDLFHYSRYPIGVGGMGQKYARIVYSLQEEDLNAVPPIEKRDWYEVELLDNPFPAYVLGSGTYEESTKWKYDDGTGVKLYEVKTGMTFTQPPNILPTTTSHWQEASWTKVWVFGLEYDSTNRHLEKGNWFWPGQVVVVFRYEDDRWPWNTTDERKWWIHETGIRTKDGDIYSLGSIPSEKRMAAFYT